MEAILNDSRRFIKPVASGYLPSYAALKDTRKIELIIRRKWTRAAGRRYCFPVVMRFPMGGISRYFSIGPDLIDAGQYTSSDGFWDWSHEGRPLQIVREYGGSANRYPFMILTDTDEIPGSADTRGRD